MAPPINKLTDDAIRDLMDETFPGVAPAQPDTYELVTADYTFAARAEQAQRFANLHLNGANPRLSIRNGEYVLAVLPNTVAQTVGAGIAFSDAYFLLRRNGRVACAGSLPLPDKPVHVPASPPYSP